MGADQSLLQFVELKEQVSNDEKFGWTLHEAHEKNGGRVSAFVYGKGLSKSREKEEFVENVVRNLKLIRHPTIVKFLAAGRKSSSYMLVTEQVRPLTSVVKILSSTEICAGLYNLIEALVFLHDKAGISHNNLSMKSVYVSDDGVWKLGGMECASTISQTKPDFMSRCRDYIDKDCIPPEEKKSVATTQVGHARDAYALGKIASQLLEQLDEFGPLVDGFQTKILELYLNADPQQRPPVRELLQDRLFKNDYVEIVTFLKMITVKSAEEKERFFSCVVEKLYYLPPELLATRLVPLLLSRFVLLDDAAGRFLLPHLLTPYRGGRPEYSETALNPVLPERAFRQYIIPELYKIYHVRDGAVRLVLLQYFPLYVQMFDRETLQSVILPQLLLGIRDLNDKIVELSLRAVADLVPILGGNILVGGPRLKYFSEGRPKFAKDSESDAANPEPFLHNGSGFRSPRHQRRLRKERKLPRGDRGANASLPSPTISAYNGDVSSTENLDRLERLDVREKCNDVIIADDDVTRELDNDWLLWSGESNNGVQENSSLANVILASDSEDDLTSPDQPTNHMAPLPTPVVDWSDTNPQILSANQNSSDNKLLSQSEPLAESALTLPTNKKPMKLKATPSEPKSEPAIGGGATAKSPAKKPANKKGDALGSEFDIRAIEIKKKEDKSEIDDLFADMQPNFPKVDLLSSLAPSSGHPRNETARAPPARSHDNSPAKTAKNESESSRGDAGRSLAYQGTHAAEAEGWGDDFVDFNEWDVDEPESNLSLSLPESVHQSMEPASRDDSTSRTERTESESRDARNDGDGISLAEDDQICNDTTESDRLPLAELPTHETGNDHGNHGNVDDGHGNHDDRRGDHGNQQACAAPAPAERRRDSSEQDRLRSESDSFLPESERNGNGGNGGGEDVTPTDGNGEDITPTEARSEVDQWLNETPEDGRHDHENFDQQQ